MKSKQSVIEELNTVPADHVLHEQKVIAFMNSSARKDFNPTEKTRYLNIGYWAHGVRSLDDAAEAMTRLVGKTAGLGPDDSVLDVGCGNGDAAMFWSAEFGPRHIQCIEINPAHAATACSRIEQAGLTDRVSVQVASAVQLPFEEETFTKVVTQEAAFQFMTREKFFHESFRVLKPGGRLVLADIVPLPGKNLHLFFNPQNRYSQHEYSRKLAGAGFVGVSITSIGQHVFKPYTNFIRSRLRPLNIKGRINIAAQRFFSSRIDYIIAVAEKPI